MAGAGAALRRASRREMRVLRRIGVGLVLNLVLAFAWLLAEPLEYTNRTKVAVIVVYLVTFVLADSVTTNMLSDQARYRAGWSTGFWDSLAVVAMRNATLALSLGVPLAAATVGLVLVSGHASAAPSAAASVLLQVFVWLGLATVLAALFPVREAHPLAWWRERRDIRTTAWRLFSVVVPYALLWVLVPSDGQRRRLPGLGAVHRRTPGVHPLGQAHQVALALMAGVAIWSVCIAIGAAIMRYRDWRPRA